MTNVTFAVAIYPYLADRYDEFDVAVYVNSPTSLHTHADLVVALLSSSFPRQRVGILSRKIPMEWARSFPTRPRPAGCLLVRHIPPCSSQP